MRDMTAVGSDVQVVVVASAACVQCCVVAVCFELCVEGGREKGREEEMVDAVCRHVYVTCVSNKSVCYDSRVLTQCR